MSPTTLYALQLTPEEPKEGDHQRMLDYEDIWTALPPRLPRAAILDCGVEGAFLAGEDLRQVVVAIEPNWTLLECARANPGARRRG